MGELWMAIFRHGNFSGDVLNANLLTKAELGKSLKGKGRKWHPGSVHPHGILTHALVVQIKTCKDPIVPMQTACHDRSV